MYRFSYHMYTWDILGFDFDYSGFNLGFFTLMERKSSLGAWWADFDFLELDNDNPLTAAGVPTEEDHDIIGVGYKHYLGSVDENETWNDKLKSGLFYLKAGFERSKTDTSVLGGFVSESDSENGLVYGFGFDTLGENTGFFLEYLKHDEDIIDDYSLKFGVNMRF